MDIYIILHICGLHKFGIQSVTQNKMAGEGIFSKHVFNAIVFLMGNLQNRFTKSPYAHRIKGL